MLVDLEPDHAECADHQTTANTLLPQTTWRFIAIASAHPTGNEVDSSQAHHPDALSVILRVPISVESLNRAICQNIDETGSDKPRALSQLKTKLGTKKLQCRVLLVDDSLSNLAVAEALLKPLGCDVVTAINGDTAIEQASKQHYDIIFMDLAMPIMDGLTATKIIRETPGPNQSAPIVALTANAFSEDRERCLANGMTDYLSKPIVRDQLIDIVKRYSKTIPNESTDGSGDQSTEENDKKVATDKKMTGKDFLDKAVLGKLRKEISAEALPTILGIYLDELEKRTTLIQQYHQDSDITALGAEAHALKSSSASFGALPLSETARELELAARESNHENIALYMENLQSLTNCTIEAIKTYLADFNSGNMEQ